MDKFILNIIHRPELMPEYLDRQVQAGKVEAVENWLFSTEDKHATVDTMFERFFEVFGFYPASTGPRGKTTCLKLEKAE